MTDDRFRSICSFGHRLSHPGCKRKKILNGKSGRDGLQITKIVASYKKEKERRERNALSNFFFFCFCFLSSMYEWRDLRNVWIVPFLSHCSSRPSDDSSAPSSSASRKANLLRFSKTFFLKELKFNCVKTIG